MLRSALALPLIVFPVVAASCQQPSSAADENKAAHAAREASCAAPSGWKNEAAAQDPAENVTNIVAIDQTGAITWNGMPVDTVRLRQYMDVVSTMVPTPGTAVEVDPGAPCAQIADVVRIVGNAVECDRLCSYATGPFDRPDLPPPAPPAPPPRP